MIPQFDPHRPLSFSSLDCFAGPKWGSPDKWYRRYILKEVQRTTPEMEFGKAFSKSVEEGNPQAPVTLLRHAEYPLSVVYDGIPLVGYIDGYTPHCELVEYKTSKSLTSWNQKTVDAHKQITLYAAMLYITYKVKPEDIKMSLEFIQTKDNGDFSIDFVQPVKIHKFETKRTMKDIVNCLEWVKETRLKMIDYCNSRAVDNQLAQNGVTSIIKV